MNKTTRTLVVVAVATLVAGIASYGVYAAVKSIPVREIEVAHAFIAVATRDLPNGSLLTEKDVKLMAWPDAAPLEGSFSKVEDVVSRGLMAPVSLNEALLESKLAPLEAGAGLPPTIPSGMRAVSVKVDEVIGVAGFVLPGTRVDVIVTLRPQSGTGLREARAQTVLSNALVLAANTKYDQDQSQEPQRSTVVTLALEPKDAEALALAANEGRISLALRHPLDVTPTETNGVGVDNLIRGRAAPAPAPAPRRTTSAPRPAPPPPVVAPLMLDPPPASYRIQTIRGGKAKEEEVGP